MVEKDVKKAKSNTTTSKKNNSATEKNATSTQDTSKVEDTQTTTTLAPATTATTTNTNGLFSFDFIKTPITKVADEIIIAGSNKNSSDIHFDPREDGMMVRFRIDGELQDYTFIPKTYERNLTTRLKLLANMNITESRLPQDGAIKGEFGGKYLDMRVSCLPLNEGEKVVIRILDYTRSLQGIDSLGFNKTNLAKLKRMMGVPNGIILVTGATGSGKSTTTYSILQGLNKPEVNIITVEDPIEMNIEGMNQVQVNSEIGMTFAAALRSILRQDPNVILIGEIRDSETAQIAVRASITGHLVLSTIHTNNSLATIERLLDMDVERYLLSTALTGIISQRLAKQLCMKCRIKRPTTKYEKKVFKRYMNRDVDEIYDANENGCEHCRRGYKGRIAIQEVLELDEEIRNALTNDKLAKEDLKEMVYTNKTITMLQDALGKALAGLTSFEEVYRVIEIESDWSEDEEGLTSSIDNEEENNNSKRDMAKEAMDIALGDNEVRDEEAINEIKPVAVSPAATISPVIPAPAEETKDNKETTETKEVETTPVEEAKDNKETVETKEVETTPTPIIPTPAEEVKDNKEIAETTPTPVEETKDNKETTETKEVETTSAPIIPAPPTDATTSTPEVAENKNNNTEQKYNVIMNTEEYTDPYNIPPKMIITDNSVIKPEPAQVIPLAEPITTTANIQPSEPIKPVATVTNPNINNVVNNINNQNTNALQNIINPANSPQIIANLQFDNSNSKLAELANNRNDNTQYAGFVLPPVIPTTNTTNNSTQVNQNTQPPQQQNNQQQLVVPKFK